MSPISPNGSMPLFLPVEAVGGMGVRSPMHNGMLPPFPDGSATPGSCTPVNCTPVNGMPLGMPNSYFDGTLQLCSPQNCFPPFPGSGPGTPGSCTPVGFPLPGSGPGTPGNCTPVGFPFPGSRPGTPGSCTPVGFPQIAVFNPMQMGSAVASSQCRPESHFVAAQATGHCGVGREIDGASPARTASPEREICPGTPEQYASYPMPQQADFLPQEYQMDGTHMGPSQMAGPTGDAVGHFHMGGPVRDFNMAQNGGHAYAVPLDMAQQRNAAFMTDFGQLSFNPGC